MLNWSAGADLDYAFDEGYDQCLHDKHERARSILKARSDDPDIDFLVSAFNELFQNDPGFKPF